MSKPANFIYLIEVIHASEFPHKDLREGDRLTPKACGVMVDDDGSEYYSPECLLSCVEQRSFDDVFALVSLYSRGRPFSLQMEQRIEVNGCDFWSIVSSRKGKGHNAQTVAA